MQKRAHVTRNRILAGAARTFERVGFADASVADIALEADVTKGALYFHFRSKEELALAVIRAEHDIASTAGAAIMRSAGTALEAAIAMSDDLARRLIADPIVRAGIRLTTEGASLGDAIKAPYLDWLETFEHLIRTSIEEGDVRADVDPAAAARFIIPAFTGVQLVSDLLTGRRDVRVRVRELWLFVLPGLVPADRLSAARALVEDVFGDVFGDASGTDQGASVGALATASAR